MANYKIRIDSSTKPPKGLKYGYGKSTAAWTTEINGHLIRGGLIYCNCNGPNKMLYEGIIAALHTLSCEHFFVGGVDSIEIFVDSQIVVRQLNNVDSALRMEKHQKKVTDFCKKHPNITFKFSYQNEEELLYKEVDILSKEGRNWLPKILTQSFKK